MNTPEILKQVLETGAVKLSGTADAVELGRITSRGDFNSEALLRVAPVLGRFIKQFVEHLPSPDLVLSKELLLSHNPEPQSMLHIDSIYTRGLSFLIPLNGPTADFYYADERLHIPSQLQAARHFAYGPSDIAIIRQRIQVNHGLEVTRVPQIYHAGIADGERELLVCDMLFDALHQPDTPIL